MGKENCFIHEAGHLVVASKLNIETTSFSVFWNNPSEYNGIIVPLTFEGWTTTNCHDEIQFILIKMAGVASEIVNNPKCTEIYHYITSLSKNISYDMLLRCLELYKIPQHLIDNDYLTSDNIQILYFNNPLWDISGNKTDRLHIFEKTTDTLLLRILWTITISIVEQYSSYINEIVSHLMKKDVKNIESIHKDGYYLSKEEIDLVKHSINNELPLRFEK